MRMSLNVSPTTYLVDDLVTLKSDEVKCVYIVKKEIIKQNTIYYLLNGLHHRIQRTEKSSNLEKATQQEIKKEEEITKKYLFGVTARKERFKRQKYVLGKILHIDGDKEYLNKCLSLYEEVGLYAYGVSIEEDKIKEQIGLLIDEVNPDVVVITGHDLYNNKGLKEIDNYVNTRYFIEAIKEIRKKRNGSCCVVAGACQSNYEALIASGADFASSPKRINIHTFDPAVIAIKIATTSFLHSVDVDDVMKYIENGKDAFGGLQTLGKMRLML